MAYRILVAMFLAGLGLLFFGPLALHPDQVLYSGHSDFLAMHLPMKRFLFGSWRETGELPLWCPHSFGGMPFIADVQVAAFYPLHWLLFAAPEDGLGACLSWLAVLHVIIAGWGMFAYARGHGFNRLAATVSAVGVMFAGKWLLHVLAGGHYIMLPLAWLPLLLLHLERLLKERSMYSAGMAGLFMALMITGLHPQMTLYAVLFACLWALATVGDVSAVVRAEHHWNHASGGRMSATLHQLGRSALRFGLVGLIAFGLSAVQLLPTLEAMPETTRGKGVEPRALLEAAWPTLLGLFGPNAHPSWEDRGGIGVVWFAAAVACIAHSPRKYRRRLWLIAGMLVFALGGATLLQWLPGFHLFQIPGRILMLLAIPISFLAGHAVHRFSESSSAVGAGSVCPRRASAVALIACAALTAAGLCADFRQWQNTASDRLADATGILAQLDLWTSLKEPAFWRYWVCAAFLGLLLVWLLGLRTGVNSKYRAILAASLLAVDTWLLTGHLVDVKPEAEIYPATASSEFLARQSSPSSGQRWRVLDRGMAEEPSSSAVGTVHAMTLRRNLEPVLGYNSFDLRRYKEFLQMIAGTDAEVRPRSGIFGYPIVGQFPIVHKSMLDHLGVRFLVQPSHASLNAPGEPQSDRTWQLRARDPGSTTYSFLAGGLRRLPDGDVYENMAVLPRAFVVHSAKKLDPKAGAMAQLAATEFTKEVLLEIEPGPESQKKDSAGSVNDTVQITNYRPNRIEIQTDSSEPGYLILSEVYYPGWAASFNGQPAELLRANYLFRAIRLPPGRHEVVFAYRPRSFELGFMISLSVLTLLASCAFISLILGCMNHAWAKSGSSPTAVPGQGREL